MLVHLAIPRQFSASLIKLCVISCITLLLLIPAWAASTEKILWTFEKGQDGAHPIGTLVFDDAGNLYGTTQTGGAPTCGPDGKGGCGTVYRLSPMPDGTWKERVLHHFTGGTDGAAPFTGVIRDVAGNLYGTTTAGGNGLGFGDGVVFELSPGAKDVWTETLLHVFGSQSRDGFAPQGLLIFDKKGNLYGTTYQGSNPCNDGTVFRLAPNPQGGWTEKVLHCFSYANSASDGTYPIAGLTIDDTGNLFGTTYLGGGQDNCCGTVFQLSTAGGKWTESVLHTFTHGGDGLDPVAGLISDKNGNLFGTAPYAGANGFGAVYELTESGGTWTEQIVYSFKGAPDAAGPWVGSLVFDQAGNLYGTTSYGGTSANCRSYGCGTVFKLTPTQNGWQESVVYSFPGGAFGASPFGGLVLDQHGNFYGTTYSGGSKHCRHGCGVAFEIIP
jgi:uncharacterized repeat protein (TIGR03803 family)